jgi:hypothetical protein
MCHLNKTRQGIFEPSEVLDMYAELRRGDHETETESQRKARAIAIIRHRKTRSDDADAISQSHPVHHK